MIRREAFPMCRSGFLPAPGVCLTQFGTAPIVTFEPHVPCVGVPFQTLNITLPPGHEPCASSRRMPESKRLFVMTTFDVSVPQATTTVAEPVKVLLRTMVPVPFEHDLSDGLSAPTSTE